MPRYITLNNFLKINNLAGTGGQAKQLIRSEQVRVNGEIETRNKKKLVAGDIVQIVDQKLTVQEEQLRDHD